MAPRRARRRSQRARLVAVPWKLRHGCSMFACSDKGEVARISAGKMMSKKGKSNRTAASSYRGSRASTSHRTRLGLRYLLSRLYEYYDHLRNDAEHPLDPDELLSCLPAVYTNYDRPPQCVSPDRMFAHSLPLSNCSKLSTGEASISSNEALEACYYPCPREPTRNTTFNLVKCN